MGKKFLDNEEAVKKFWVNVIDMCNRRGITTTKLSHKLGKSPNHISNMKSQNINPTLVKIKNIAECAKCHRIERRPKDFK